MVPQASNSKFILRGSISNNRLKSFEPLTLETKALYDRCVGLMPRAMTSSLCFQSLYAWNFALIVSYKVLNGHLCITASDTKTGEVFAFPPLGVLNGKSFASAVHVIFGEFIRDGLTCVFQEIPFFMLPYFSAIYDFKLYYSYNNNWSDYLFTKDDFEDGIRKKSSREALRSFERKFRPNVHEITSKDSSIVRAITQKYFCGARNCSDCLCGCELDVVSRMMEGWDALGMKGVIVGSEGEAIAFGSVCFQKDTMFFFSKKVRKSTRGLNEYLNSVLMENFARDCKYINYSDDMGIDGLRAYKSRLGKHILLPKYMVRFSRR